MPRQSKKPDTNQRKINEIGHKSTAYDNSEQRVRAQLRRLKQLVDNEGTAELVQKYQDKARELKTYLDMPSKRTAEAHDEAGSSKHAHFDDEPMEASTAPGTADIGGSAGAAMSATGGGAPTAAAGGIMGGGGAGGGSMRGASLLPRGVHQRKTTYTRTYKKQYSLRLTWDNIKYIKVTSDLGGDGATMLFPVFEIPWEFLGFYLTKDEIHELYMTKTRSQVKNVKVDLHNFTAILNFEVGASNATVGNNNVGFRAAIMKNQRGMRHGTYTDIPGNVIENVFWGNHAVNLPASGTLTSANVASLGAWLVTRNYNLRFQHFFAARLNQIGNVIPTMYNPTAFNWKSFFDNRRNVSMNEGFWHSKSYQPKQGYITGREAVSYFAQSLASASQFQQPGNWRSETFLENINKLYQLTAPITRFVGTEDTTYPNMNYAGPDTSTLPNTPSNSGALINGGAINMVDNPFPTTNGSYVPGGANNDFSFGSMPAQFHVAESEYKHIRIDNNHFMSRHHTHDSNIPQETFAIALDLLINNTAENETINGWMEIILDTELEMEIEEGQCAPFYPQGQSGAYPLCHPMPNAFNPVMEIGGNLMDVSALGENAAFARAHMNASERPTLETMSQYKHEKSWRETNLGVHQITTTGQVGPGSAALTRQMQTRSMTKEQQEEKNKIAEKKKEVTFEEVSESSEEEGETTIIPLKHVPTSKDKNYIQSKLKFRN